MSFLDAVILAVIQGLTEFLPISSSGHLVLGEALLGGDAFPDSIAFEVVVHLGTFLAVILVFWQDIKNLFMVLLKWLSTPMQIPKGARNDPEFRFILFLLLGMLPAGFVGLLLRDRISAVFSEPLIVSGTLVVTGLLLLGTRFVPPGQRVIGFGSAILIGLAQALALLPGISRSGATISTALFLRIPQAQAARFSFIMVLPLILAATLLEMVDLLRSGIPAGEWMLLTTGLVVSFLTGWVSLKWLLALLQRGHFHHFAWYCFLVAAFAFFYFK